MGGVTLRFELKENWDFKDNPEYGYIKNLLYERLAGEVASWNSINPKEFIIKGSFSDSIYLITEQYHH